MTGTRGASARLFVVAAGTRSTGSSRLRLWNYRRFLEADGVALVWEEYRGGRVRAPVEATRLRWDFLRRLLRLRPGPGDRVLVQKILPPLALVRRWRSAGATVVYDFDDALTERAPTGEGRATVWWRSRRFRAMLRAADRVIAGSSPLAELASGITDAPVEILLPSLDRDWYASAAWAGEARPAGGSLRVGWVGSDQNLHYLRLVTGSLERAAGLHPGLRLSVCSAAPPRLTPRLDPLVDFVPWSERAELDAVGRFDIAISPLTNDRWSRSRGGRASVLSSLGAGVPVVASRGGGLDDLVRKGKGGILFAETREEWDSALDTLLGNASERRRQGAEARRLIDENVWADVLYPRFKTFVLGE